MENFLVDLNPVIGSEQKGVRPVLIISDEDYSLLMPLVTILPITSLRTGRRIYPNEILIETDKNESCGLANDSIILAHQVRAISKKRLRNNLGSIDSQITVQNIEEALRIHLNL